MEISDMFEKKYLVFAVALALGANVAAETLPDGSTELENVNVTGHRRYNGLVTENSSEYSSFAATVGTKSPASLREIPQSVSILTNQQIKDRNVDTLDQLAKQTPALRVLSNDDGRSSIYSRGYEYSEYSVDGLSAPMASIYGTMPNLFAFDRVELMRGPSGLFDSSGEMGGIVNLVRKRPTKDLQGHIGAGFGTRRQYKVEGDVSGSLNADGSVRGRVMAQTFGKAPRPAKKNNHHETVYAALDWDIGPQTTFGAGYLFQKRHITPDNGLPLGADGKLLPLRQNVFVGAPWNKFTLNSHEVFADLKHYFGNGGYGKAGVRYADRDSDSNYAFGGSKLTPRNTLSATGLGIEAKQKSLTIDASYSQRFTWGNTANEYVVGADYKNIRSTILRGQYPVSRAQNYYRFGDLAYVDVLARAPRLANAAYIRTETRQKETGAYGKLVIRPIDDLSLIAGGRIGHYNTEYENSTRRAGRTRRTASSKGETKFTGYLGTVWNITPANSLYASYSTLYRPQPDAVGRDGNALKARQGTQFEFGYKGAYFDDKLNTRVSFYRLKDKNAAATVGNSVYSEPLAKRVMQGVETEISGAVTDKWQIHAGYSYLDTKIKTPSRAASSDDLLFLMMPKHTASLWTSYAVTPEFTLGGGINAMSGFESNQHVKTGGYATVDLMAGYAFTPKLKAQLNINNLFNRKYYARAGTANTFNIPGAERSAVVNIRYDF